MDMTHTRVSAVPVKERKDECQMLRMTYSGGKKGKKRKLNVGVTFTALPAQVSIRWASELALKIPTSPLSELMATIAHSYGASDGRRQKMKAVALVPFPAQKPTVISWGTTADPGQCQPGAAGEGRALGAADCFPAVFYGSPKHHEITWFFFPSELQYKDGATAQRGPKTQWRCLLSAAQSHGALGRKVG